MPGSFWFTWKVEKIHVANHAIDNCISTEAFQVGLLQNTKWKLHLKPRGIDNPLYMGCFLHRIRSSSEYTEPELIKLKWKISVIAEGGIVRFEKCVCSTLKCNDMDEVQCFIRKSELLPTDTPQHNLTIFCEMTNDELFSLEQDLKYDYEVLSSNLRDLLESGFRSDFTINCTGEIFRVHKFILVSRWPKFCQRFEIDDISTVHDLYITDIKSATLKVFLTYLYSGKLKRDDISMELCKYMHEQHCDAFMASLETPASSLEFITHLQYEEKHLIWEVGDADVWKTCKTHFFRVIPLQNVYPSELVIIFDFEKIDGVEWLKLVALFIGFTQFQPLHVQGKISFVNKETVVCFREFTYLIETSDEWYFPQLVKKDDLLPNEGNSKCIDILLCICDGHLPTRQVLVKINNASNFSEAKDYHKLIMDCYQSSYVRDLELKIGSYSYMIHSPIFAARSAKFRKLLENSEGAIEIEQHMTKEASHSFVCYLYGQNPSKLDIADTILLRNMAKRYSLGSLEERTRKTLEGLQS